MIKSLSFDVEIFVNLFSVTFVDLQDYMRIFADCVDSKGKPVALTEKLTVAEIKSRLDKVKSKIFWISDTDDSQLVELVAYINNMQSHYDTKEDENGNVTQIPVRTDLFGFNNQGYDDLMIKGFMMHYNRYDSTKNLIKYLYNLSKKIISLQGDRDAFYGDKDIDLLKYYKLPYATVDLQRVYGLHSASVVVDKEGNRNKFGKSLKQTCINLKWHELLDFRLPPIDEEEYNAYWKTIDRYRGMSLEHLNDLITNDFERYVLPKYIKPMLYYNKNDDFVCCEMARQKPDEIKLRYSITQAFKVNVLCSARANIADKLTIAFYSKMSGLHQSQFEKGRTERTRLSFNKIIFPHIKFKTKELQYVLEYMITQSVYHTNSTDKAIPMRRLTDYLKVSDKPGVFKAEVDFYGTRYTLACGGIHTQDAPVVLESDDKCVYKHFDYNSYYPSIIVSYNIAPKHLNNKVFVDMVRYFRDTRVKCKHTPDSEGYVIAGVPNKIAAEALKIVINSIYGKFGRSTAEVKSL